MSLAEAIPMQKLPQVLVNVELADREALAGATAVWGAVKREEADLEGRGRVLLRPSGTEPAGQGYGRGAERRGGRRRLRAAGCGAGRELG